MSKPYIVYTRDFDKTQREAEAAGGRVLHRLTPSAAVLLLPKGAKPSKMKTCSSKPGKALNAHEKQILKCWKATDAQRGTLGSALMARSAREGITWDAPSFQAPGSHVPGAVTKLGKKKAKKKAAVALSTGTPTSLYLTDSVAIGLIIVSGNSWHRVSGSLKYVSVAKDGTVWGVNNSNQIFRRSGNRWQRMSGALKQISVGSSTKIWGVNSSDEIFYRSGNSWKRVAGALKHVSVASDGTVWGVNSSDQIFRRSGNTWQRMSGALKHISVGSQSNFWSVNSADSIFTRKILATP